jgi:S-disulfanyl-L-cysteine oxidoreductase SoxD
MLNARLLLPLVFVAAGLGATRLDRTTGDGVYTAAQADQGAQLFAEVCMQCHLPNWEKDKGFYAKWQGKPLSALATYIKREMPQTDPGSLTSEEYAAVTAYLLRLTGNPAGDTPLNTDPDALVDIRIDTLSSGR